MSKTPGVDRLKKVIGRLWRPRHFEPALAHEALNPEWAAQVESRIADIERRQSLTRLLVLIAVAEAGRGLLPKLLDLLK
jgi:hypothetical protein